MDHRVGLREEGRVNLLRSANNIHGNSSNVCWRSRWHNSRGWCWKSLVKPHIVVGGYKDITEPKKRVVELLAVLRFPRFFRVQDSPVSNVDFLLVCNSAC